MISQVTARSADCETFRVLPLIQKDDSYTERLRHCYRVGHIIIIGLTRTDLTKMPNLPRVDEVVRSVNCMQLCCCPCCSFANLVTVTVVCIAPPTGRPRAHHKTIRLSRWVSAGRMEQRCFQSATKSIGHRLTVIH